MLTSRQIYDISRNTKMTIPIFGCFLYAARCYRSCYLASFN